MYACSISITRNVSYLLIKNDLNNIRTQFRLSAYTKVPLSNCINFIYSNLVKVFSWDQRWITDCQPHDRDRFLALPTITRFRSIKLSVGTVGVSDIVIIFHCFIVVNGNFNVKVGGVLSQIVCVGLFFFLFTCKLFLLFLCFSLLFARFYFN